MFQFKSRYTKDSLVCPGVVVTLLRITDKRRTALRARLAEPLEKLRGIQAELESFNIPSGDDAVVAPDIVARVMTLNDQIQSIQKGDLDPIYGEVCFFGVTGLELDVEPEGKMTFEHLREHGPEGLCEEIVAWAREEAELSASERKNSESPTTSVGSADGDKSGTTAASADATSSISPETVGGIFLVK